MSKDEKQETTGFATKPFIDANYMREKRNVDPIRNRLYEYITGQKLVEIPETRTIQGPPAASDEASKFLETYEEYDIQTDQDGRLVARFQTGNWIRKYQQYSPPKLNEEGAGYLMSAFDLTINNQTVMGNINKQELWSYLGRRRISLASNLWENSDRYELDMKAHYHGLIDEFMSCAELFLTRPVDNKERESDTQSTKYVETNQPAGGGGGGRRGVKGLLGL